MCSESFQQQKTKKHTKKEEFMAKEYGVISLTVRNLENNEFSQLMTESKEAIAAFNKAHKVESIYTSKLEEMSQHLAKFQEGLHQTKASRLVK